MRSIGPVEVPEAAVVLWLVVAGSSRRKLQTRRPKPVIRGCSATRVSSAPRWTGCGRWLVSASGGFLEPQLGLRPASRAV